MWYEVIALYVVIHRTPEDLRALQIDEVCPTLITNRGGKPTVKSLWNSKPEKRFSNWAQPAREPNTNEKR